MALISTCGRTINRESLLSAVPPFLLPERDDDVLSCDVDRDPAFNPLETVGDETLETVLRAEPPLLAVLSTDEEPILLETDEAELEADNAGLLTVTGFFATSALLAPEVLEAEPASEATAGFTATREEFTEISRSSGSELRTSSPTDEAPLLAPAADSVPVFLLPSEIDAF